MDTDAEEDRVDEPVRPPRRRRRWARRVVLIVVAVPVVGYLVIGFFGNGVPWRAGPDELRRAESAINQAYAECGLDERASINWLWGQVEVPKGDGFVPTMPDSVQLTRDELRRVTGSANYFWAVCP